MRSAKPKVEFSQRLAACRGKKIFESSQTRGPEQSGALSLLTMMANSGLIDTQKGNGSSIRWVISQ
jgi:hypothetical protein